jgi:hypothetical protein
MECNKLLLPLALLTLSGCSISTTVKPVEVKISEICIKNNPAVLMDGFLPELQAQIESHHIKTKIFDDVLRKDCPYQLEYVANWRWDIVMWLMYAELKVYENDSRKTIGEAVYDAKWGGGRPDKFGPAANNLKTLTDTLFKN